MIAAKPRPTAATGPAGQTVLPALLSRPYPAVMGVLNANARFILRRRAIRRPERALAQARRMIAEGADIIDIGAEIHPALRVGTDLGGGRTDSACSRCCPMSSRSAFPSRSTA